MYIYKNNNPLLGLGMSKLHPKGRSHCFVFDYQFEVAKFSKRQNQSVQKTPLICMCPTLSDYPGALSIRQNACKLNTFLFIHQTKSLFFSHFFIFPFIFVSVCAHSELGMYNLCKIYGMVMGYWL